MVHSYNKEINFGILKSMSVLLLILMSSVQISYGSHAAGADLTYRWLSGNTYEVTAAFYRDCAGINRPNTVTLNYRSINCNVNTNVTLPLVNNGPIITFPCNSVQTTCTGGTTPGIQQWLYRGNITLPFACTDWKLSYQVIARNCAISTIVQPSPCNSTTSYEPIYVEALLNNLDAPGNSSPTFSNVPISFVCLGQDFNYNHGVIDIDADSLSYSLITPMTSGSTGVTYLGGYSASSPIASSPAFSINAATGDLFMHPTMIQVSVVAVKIEEFRNGILIGSVIRDMQIYSRNCTPNIVPFATGIGGSSNFSAYLCPGANICFDINSGDANPGQSVIMTWNSGVPGATFNIAGSPYPTGTFCWTPQASDARPQPYTFTVTVRDDACPINGVQTYSFQIFVPELQVNVVSSDFNGYGVSCKGDANGTLTAVPAIGINPFTYSWNTIPVQTTASISGLDPGAYNVTVTDSIGCQKTFSGSITEPDELVATITSSVDPTCGLNNGSATLSAVGGAGVYGYSWSDGQITQTALGLAPGAYTGTVTDGNGCANDAQISLQNVSDPYSATEFISLCEGSTYELPNGNLVSTTGVYISELLTSLGCDSIITTDLTVNDIITTQVSASICDGDSYILPDGSSVSVADVYTTTLVSVNNCDSIVVTTLTLNPVYSSTEYISICSGSSYILPNGNSVSVADTYISNLLTVAGCDSIITTELTVNPVVSTQVSASICEGDSYILPDGSSVSSPNVYTTVLVSINNCDSIIVTTLAVNPVYSSTEYVSICSGSSYVLPNGNSVSVADTYISNLLTIAGCDSIITTELSINPVITNQVSASICEGDSYILPDGSSVTIADVYTTSLVSVNNCDSIVVTTLTVNSVYSSTEHVSICSGSSYELPNGNSVSVADTYISALLTAAGCDSIITTVLTVNPVITTNVNASICDGDTYILPDGTEVDEAGVYNTSLISFGNCDSIVVTNLVLNQVYTTTETIEICVGLVHTLPNGTAVSDPGVYTSVLESVSGCDSTIVTTLSHIVVDLPVVTASGPLSFCGGGSVTLTSSPAASYQWVRNGVDIPGATAQSYTTTKAGNFKVRVPTQCGDRLSLSSIVIKNVLPPVTVSPSGTVTICLHDNVVLSAITNIGNLSVSYQWYRYGVLIPGATNDTYTASTTGKYKVIVTDTQTGCSRASTVTHVVKKALSAQITPDKPLVTCKVDITMTLSTNAGAGASYQWKKNGVAIQGATGMSYMTSLPGNYNVLVTNASGCSKHSNTLTIIEKCDKKDDNRFVNVFPNPVKEKVFIEKAVDSNVLITCEIYDITGKVMLEMESMSTESGKLLMEMETSSLKSGIYFIRINDDSQIYTQKIIVQ